MKIAYCPFDDDATVAAIYDNIKGFHRTGVLSHFLEKFDLRVRVHRNNQGRFQPLRDVRFDQQLYVFGHGNEGAEDIMAMDGSTLTLWELAARLLLDGLSISHKKLKLFSCLGGKGGADSMAAKLKSYMVKLGFTNITVYGYTESLMIGTQGAIGEKYGESGTRAKKLRIAF